MASDKTAYDDDPWLIPLHGTETPGKAPAPPVPPEDVVASYFTDDDELPTIEFRPRLRRSA